MQRLYVHKPDWIHIHKPDWHLFGTRLEHLVHDPRFWAAVAFVVILGAMIALAILSPGRGTGTPLAPIYPYSPYLP
jgi:hypothetical protein